MNHTEVIEKLIGPVNPAGSTHIDEFTNENLKALCEVAQNLVQKVRDVYNDNKNRREFSMKKASEIAEKCLIEYNIPFE